MDNSNDMCALLERVSTDIQAEKGYSIGEQKERLESFCISKGWNNFEHYTDAGYTGANMDRPELHRLIRDIKDGKIRKVIVYKLDRLSRSLKDTIHIIEDIFLPHDVAFISITEAFDTSTPIGRCIIAILSAFAQLERENIRERSRMGIAGRLKAKKWKGGAVSFGYDYDKEKGILVPNKERAEIVKQIYSLYMEGYSLQTVANMLGLKYSNKLRHIIETKTNIGTLVYNGIEYKNCHEPIIDEETYARTMNMRKERSFKTGTNEKNLLTGLMICGKCGAKMFYAKWSNNSCKSESFKIKCYSQQKHQTYLIKDANCDNKRLWSTDVENAVVDDLLSFINKYFAINNTAIKIDTLSLLNSQHQDIAKQIKKLYTLYASSENDMLLETIQDMQKNLCDIQKQIEEEKENEKITKSIKLIGRKLTNLKDTWPFMTNIEKKNLLRSCIEKIILTDGALEIFYKFEGCESINAQSSTTNI